MYTPASYKQALTGPDATNLFYKNQINNNINHDNLYLVYHYQKPQKGTPFHVTTCIDNFKQEDGFKCISFFDKPGDDGKFFYNYQGLYFRLVKYYGLECSLKYYWGWIFAITRHKAFLDRIELYCTPTDYHIPLSLTPYNFYLYGFMGSVLIDLFISTPDDIASLPASQDIKPVFINEIQDEQVTVDNWYYNEDEGTLYINDNVYYTNITPDIYHYYTVNGNSIVSNLLNSHNAQLINLSLIKSTIYQVREAIKFSEVINEESIDKLIYLQ